MTNFSVFYLEGRALLEGRPLYDSALSRNLNTYALTVLMFAPLALLPYPGAAGLWLAVSIVGCAGRCPSYCARARPSRGRRRTARKRSTRTQRTSTFMYPDTCILRIRPKTASMFDSIIAARRDDLVQIRSNRWAVSTVLPQSNGQGFGRTAQHPFFSSTTSIKTASLRPVGDPSFTQTSLTTIDVTHRGRDREHRAMCRGDAQS